MVCALPLHTDNEPSRNSYLGNCGCMGGLVPCMPCRLLPTYVAFLMSVVLVVFLGEMFPMAVFTGPRQLHLASLMCPLVWVLIFLTTPIAWPIAKLLDFVLGDSSTITRYNRQQMQTLVNLHQVTPPGGQAGRLSGCADGIPFDFCHGSAENCFLVVMRIHWNLLLRQEEN